jgi:CheY-like chemotaxis protein
MMSTTLPDLRPKDLATLRVLLVDDNYNAQRLIADVLQAAGVSQTETAPDGDRALEKIEAWNPDLIISDWHMPVMGGLELTRLIRRAALCPDRRIPNPLVPVILVTSRRGQADVQMAREAGVNEFVIKPFTPAALLARFQAALLNPRPFILSEEYVGSDRRRRASANYAGPLRRNTDQAEVRDTIEFELKAVRAVVGSGRIDGEVRAGVYRAMQRISYRTHQVRYTAVQRAAVLLMEYIDAMASPESCEIEVFDLHFRAIATLLEAASVDVEKAAAVIAQLEAIVRHKIAQRRAA